MLNHNFKTSLLIPTLIVFGLCFGAGHALSRHHPLVNDEIYTEIGSIESLSYYGILTFRISEGNVSPLFYILQKGYLDLIHFRLPFVWNHDWFVKDVPSQIIMRMPANFFMSLAVTLIFYFFSRFYSLGAGIYSLLVALSSYMIWAYWVEARPYPLWCLLTTVQFLLLVFLLKEGKGNQSAKWALVAVHLLLSFLVGFSAVQIVAVSMTLFLSGERKLRQYVFLTGVPVLLCFIYYLGSHRLSFYFIDSPLQIISANIPKERLFLVFLLAGTSVWLLRDQKGKWFSWDVFKDANFAYLSFLILLLLGNAAVLILFALKARANYGFSLSNRYFIDLAPAGIIALCLFSAEMWRILQGKRLARIMLFLVLAAFLLFRFVRTWELIRGYYHL